MRTDDLDYELPPEAIAREGAEPRDAARLLVDHHDHVDHLRVGDLAGLVGPGDVVVVNETRVRAARLRFRRPSGGSAEVLLLEPLADGWWEALARPSSRLAPGLLVAVAPDLTIEMGADLGEGRRRVRLVADDQDAALATHGEVPLPPYLAGVTLSDPERYQTVFGRRASSVAAPTAGLHLTPGLLAAMTVAGADVRPVELEVGLGTFRPIATAEVGEHRMHAERYTVPAATWAACGAARRVVAIGTTTVRALESAAATGELAGRTELFLRRGARFEVVDTLLTNFHQPRSSLLALLDAFIGDRWRELYAVALAGGYRFLSLGDAMLVGRTGPPEPPR